MYLFSIFQVQQIDRVVEVVEETLKGIKLVRFVCKQNSAEVPYSNSYYSVTRTSGALGMESRGNPY